MKTEKITGSEITLESSEEMTQEDLRKVIRYANKEHKRITKEFDALASAQQKEDDERDISQEIDGVKQ